MSNTEKPTQTDNKEYGLLGFIKGGTVPASELDSDRVSTYPNLVSREFIAFGCLVMCLLVFSYFFDSPLEELANPGKTPNPAKAPWYFLSLQEMLHYAPPFIAGVFIPGLLIVIMLVLPFFRGRMALVPVMMLVASLIAPLFDGVIWTGLHAVAPGFADAIRVYGFPTLAILFASVFLLAKFALTERFDDEKVVELWRKRTFVTFVVLLAVLVMIGQFFRGPEWKWIWPWQ